MARVSTKKLNCVMFPRRDVLQYHVVNPPGPGLMTTPTPSDAALGQRSWECDTGTPAI